MTGAASALPLLAIALAMSVYLLILGIRFRAGNRRTRLARWYFDTRVPLILRRLGFVTFPLSAMGLLGVATTLSLMVDPIWVGILGIVLLFIGGPVLMVMTLLFLAWPPRFLKPKWIVEEEQRRRRFDRDS